MSSRRRSRALVVNQHTAIPRTDADTSDPNFLQAIANTAAFHFPTIEQGGSSLYPSLAQRATDVEVLRILMSIGPTETMHFQTWSDVAGNAPPLTAVDPVTGVRVTFPDLEVENELFDKALIMPEPCPFLNTKPSHCFDHSTNEHAWRRHGCTAVPKKHGSFHRPIASVFRVYDPTGTRSRRCHPRCLRDTRRLNTVRIEGKGSKPRLRTPNRQHSFPPATACSRMLGGRFFSFTSMLFGELSIVLRKLRNIAGRAGFHLTLAIPCSE